MILQLLHKTLGFFCIGCRTVFHTNCKLFEDTIHVGNKTTPLASAQEVVKFYQCFLTKNPVHGKIGSPASEEGIVHHKNDSLYPCQLRQAAAIQSPKFVNFLSVKK